MTNKKDLADLNSILAGIQADLDKYKNSKSEEDLEKLSQNFLANQNNLLDKAYERDQIKAFQVFQQNFASILFTLLNHINVCVFLSLRD